MEDSIARAFRSMVADILSRILGGIILASGGWGVGAYVADVWGPQLFIAWAFGLAGAGALIGLAATPYATRAIARGVADRAQPVPTSRLLSGALGLILGLLTALLVSIPLFLSSGGWLALAFPIALSLILGYVGATLMFAPSRDVFQKIIPPPAPPDGEESAAASESAAVRAPAMLVDTSAIIDGRIAAVTKTGFVQSTLIIPRFVLDELRHVADSGDSMRRARGRRGLETLNEIRRDENVRTEFPEIDYPQADEVDAKLIGLAKSMPAAILTTDFNLNRVAQLDGITALNLNDLANSLRPVLLPGEKLRLRIVHEGKEFGQGVGYLEDGTMVVVESGARHIDADLDVTVARVLQTSAGSMIFANPS